MPLGDGALGEFALGEFESIVPAPTPGQLKQQFRKCQTVLAEVAEGRLSPRELQKWRRFLVAIERAIPGPPRKVDKALARYDASVAAAPWRCQDRKEHARLKKEACEGICTVDALNRALRERAAEAEE